MPHEDGVPKPDLAAGLQDVPRVALEGAVAAPVIRREVRPARADVVEEDDPMLVREGGSHEAPHVLVAPEAVGEDHGLAALGARDLDVVPPEDVHGSRKFHHRRGVAPVWR